MSARWLRPRRRPAREVRRTPFLGPPEAARVAAQADHQAISRSARLRLLEEQHEGELAAKDAVADSWRARCVELARERNAAQAEVKDLTMRVEALAAALAECRRAEGSPSELRSLPG